MRSISQEFYHSKAWTDCRSAYIKQHPLCEICLSKGLIVPAEIVHHKVHLTESNVQNPEIALNHNNLQSVCRSCHNNIHFKQHNHRWRYVDGQLVVDEGPLS